MSAQMKQQRVRVELLRDHVPSDMGMVFCFLICIASMTILAVVV